MRVKINPRCPLCGCSGEQLFTGFACGDVDTCPNIDAKSVKARADAKIEYEASVRAYYNIPF